MKIVTSLIAASAFMAIASNANADKEIYDTKCASCHATGVAEAPIFGDKDAWAPRIATGMDSLLAVSIKGKGAMPPKGACMDCTDAQLKSAIQYMIDAAK